MGSFYSPLAISAPFYGYLNLLKLHRTERSRNKDVRSGNQNQDLLHQGPALTNCAILAPSHVNNDFCQPCNFRGVGSSGDLEAVPVGPYDTLSF